MSAIKFTDLPDDILDIVFVKLDIRQKFLYQPVSRKWSDIIFNTCTKFSNVEIGFDCNDPDHLIIPSLGYMPQHGLETERILKTLGPNLNVVHFQAYRREDVQFL